MPENLSNGTGRRKTSVARAWLRQGESKILVNNRSINDYFPREAWITHALEPLNVTNTLKKYDIIIKVNGGGLTGQAGAVRHALARALVKIDESFKKPLKSAGLLSRDPRMVESKKYGKRKARRGQQFSKR